MGEAGRGTRDYRSSVGTVRTIKKQAAEAVKNTSWAREAIAFGRTYLGGHMPLLGTEVETALVLRLPTGVMVVFSRYVGTLRLWSLIGYRNASTRRNESARLYRDCK